MVMPGVYFHDDDVCGGVIRNELSHQRSTALPRGEKGKVRKTMVLVTVPRSLVT